MNKKELIEKYEYLNHDCFRRVDTSEVLKDLKQLDELQKPVIPQFVANYIEYTKEKDYHIFGAMKDIGSDEKLDDWFWDDGNMEIFARAWIEGYEVGKEPKYIVKIKNVLDLFGILNFSKHSQEWYFSDSNTNSHHKTAHTRKELEEAGFGWVFDCEGIEIEEVEE